MSRYINRTREEILQSLLNEMPDEYLKGIGTFTHDFNKAISFEYANCEEQISEIWNFFDIAALTGADLEERVYQLKGITRKQATHAIGEITVTGNGTITTGDLFETPYAVQFIATETIKVVDVATVKVQAAQPGKIGNVGAKSIILMPKTIQGIKSVNNIKATYDGFDAETDASLLERYLIAVRTPATSGNKYHYKQWSREVEGVGDSRVFPLWNGANTVKVVIIDDNQQPASPELVKKVQDHIDPPGENNETWGAGYGEAPIGAYCTVLSAAAKEINVNITLIKEPDADPETLKKDIEKSIVEFLQEIAFNKNYVSYSLLANAVLETPGVIEWTELSINGGTNSITVGEEEVAVLKGLAINEQ